MTLLRKKQNGDLIPSLTNDFFGNRFFGTDLTDYERDFFNGGGIKVPLANVSETASEFKVDLSAPGLNREDFKVEIEDGALVISAEKEEEKKEEKENYKRQEFSYNSFSRSFQLPENVSEDKINAKYENGMLHISIPKKEVSAPKAKKAIKVA
jgi:HSP20 family protein